jgi:GMP synthase (glutamine-hydrolysing)
MRSGSAVGVVPSLLVLRHVPHEDLGTFAPLLTQLGCPFRYLDVTRPGVVFPPLRNVLGLIVLGGPMGVYEKREHPFLRGELAYLRRALKAEKPLLGVCLGAQLIAHALGARVYPNTVKEIGWYPLHRTALGERDPLFSRFPKTSTVFQWHGDTFDLPKGAHLLATAPLCRNQAFVWGRRVYGLQFHVEVNAAMVRRWLKQPGVDRELSASGAQSRRMILNEVSQKAGRLETWSSRVFLEFASLLGFPGPRSHSLPRRK